MSTENEVKLSPEFLAHQKIVRERVAMNNHTSWGGDDSAAVIKEMMMGVGEGNLDAHAAIPLTIQHVNASAFRQKLEKLDEKHPAYVAPSGKKRGERAGVAGV